MLGVKHLIEVKCFLPPESVSHSHALGGTFLVGVGLRNFNLVVSHRDLAVLVALGLLVPQQRTHPNRDLDFTLCFTVFWSFARTSGGLGVDRLLVTYAGLHFQYYKYF